MTPGATASFVFSPAVNSPAAFAAHLRHRGSPANFPLTFTPNTAAAAQALGYDGRTPAYLQSLPPDESKKRELEDILRKLQVKPGRISVEGIERLAKRLG